MTLIAHKLTHHHPVLHLNKDPQPLLKSPKLMQNTPETMDEAYVYIGYADEFQGCFFDQPAQKLNSRKFNMICIGNLPNFSMIRHSAFCNLIILPKNQEMSLIFNEVQDIFDFFTDWDNDLQVALMNRNSLQNMLDICRNYNIFENPVYIIDSTYNIVAQNMDENDDGNDSDASSHVKTLFSSIDEKTRLETTTYPVLVTSGETGRQLLFANIHDGSKRLGSLLVPSENTYLNGYHIFVASHFSAALLESMNSTLHSDSAEATNYHYFIIALIENRTVYKNFIENQLNRLDWKIDDLYQLIRVECLENKQSALEHFVWQFADMLPGVCAAIYGEQLLLIMDKTKNPGAFEGAEEKFCRFLKTKNLRAGISGEFRNFLELRQYYLQTDVSLQLGKYFEPASVLFKYENYVIYHMISTCSQHMNLSCLCHPVLLKLAAYDTANDTDYLRTLYCYMKNDKSFVKASRELYIHRNTFVYRINKILEMIDIDLDNGDTKTHILLSYGIIKYMEVINRLKNYTASPNTDINDLLNHWRFN